MDSGGTVDETERPGLSSDGNACPPVLIKTEPAGSWPLPPASPRVPTFKVEPNFALNALTPPSRSGFASLASLTFRVAPGAPIAIAILADAPPSAEHDEIGRVGDASWGATPNANLDRESGSPAELPLLLAVLVPSPPALLLTALSVDALIDEPTEDREYDNSDGDDRSVPVSELAFRRSGLGLGRLDESWDC